ncbi:MAG: glyceraldehyde 3-phosphate dehydrogenase NAD-binding domain-containing protein [Lutibacter sp.]|uniref:type I glyceraldehyde-3-phosphate dehydrogenase n=1 Tax=Lutibacter sp. TaxID=1925666 RepID=UPI00299F2591|nr:glyceraldehyde 3-phosphate dehydrogenase NAD-binding domain-containing protein [Lutibacter sp.]MDX1829235.1 glyceraldehyde 3-phosphate dehydrogenase NAD-binding domain-containing protein [Lutibacter sp.]
MKRIAINGFGRIGRAALKVIISTPQLEVVAINDLMSIENAAYLFKYDSVYGMCKNNIIIRDNYLLIDDKKILFLNKKDPANLPWKSLNIDVVIESTGLFTKKEDAEKHILAGAKIVVISAPTKSKDTPTVLHGVNTLDEKKSIFSCASCTTNNIGPVMEIIDRRIGIKKAILNTIHSFTASQSLVDAPSKRDLRMGRSAVMNLVPASTGAAIATIKALPQLEGKFDGVAVRTPVPVGSISDITFVAARNTSVAEINNILIEESKTDRYKLVLATSNEPLVSSDIIQNPFASIVDLAMTRVVDGDLVKIMTWYDNEWGFTNQMIREIQLI